MVVGHFRGQLCYTECVVQVRVNPADGRHPHAGAVAEAAVGFRVRLVQPVVEAAAVARVVVLASEGLHLFDDRAADGVIVVRVVFHERLRNGERHDRVVRRTGVLVEQLKVIVLGGVEFVVGTDDVPKDST